MQEYKLDDLNGEQLIPVTDTEGAILVTAGAGSGKTRMLTHRITYLVSNKGVSPYNILAITFTNKAASEMRERLHNMLPDIQGLWVSTFHSMCVTILRKFIDHIGFSPNFSIYSETEKERTIKNSIKECGFEDEDGLSKRISSAISSAKNEGYSPDEYAVVNKFMHDIDAICAVYADYEKELLRSNALDFDDLLLCAHKLLKESEEARSYYQNRFKYIHVDEFQDTNTIQYKLLIQLAAKHRNIFAVGDEDQSIYGWRGANIDNIRNFIKDYGAKVYKLEQNYRSTQKIIAAANTLIGNNTMRIEKKLWTENEDGLDISYYAAQKDSGECDYVMATIASLRGKGYKFSDIAILMRVNALSRGFEQRLLQYGVPYKVFGGFKFFERKEVKDILAYARMIANPLDNEAISRIINFPKRGIGDAALKQISNYAALRGESLFDTIINIERNLELPLSVISKIKTFSKIVISLLQKKNLRPHEFLAAIVDIIELKALYAEPTEENQNRIMHIGELIESAAEFAAQNEGGNINDYLQMVTLYTDTDEIDESKDYISVATVHSAKGLEFPVVFIVGLEEALFPLSRAANDNSELEEERRLMYVAITRAEKRLYLTRSRARFLYGTTKDTLPSRFLTEIGVEVVEKTVPKPKMEDSYIGGEYSHSYANRSYDRDISYRNSDNNAVAFKKSGSESSYTNQAAVAKQTSSASYKNNDPKPINSVDVTRYKVGVKVKHRRFGEGTILSIQQTGNNYAEIQFSSGKMTLALNFAPLEIIE